GVQADAQVAEPVLLDLCLRPQVLPGGGHQVRELPRRGQDHLRRLLPDGAIPGTDLPRYAERAVPCRGLAQVPLPERGPRSENRRLTAALVPIALTDEQLALAEAVAKLSARHCDPTQTRAR